LTLSAAAFAGGVVLQQPIWPAAIAGAVAAGVAVAIRPREWFVWLLATCTGAMSAVALPDSLDSIRLMISVLTVVATAGTILLLLPSAARRIAISLVIVFHFVGILTAITVIQPQPWLSGVIWTYVYRPYLEFIYMTNAYHFYSPEPGPACMMWFYVKYEDGTHRWVTIPRREDYPLTLEYQRRLSFTESINQLHGPLSIPEDKRTARLEAAQKFGIPGHPVLADIFQYRVPLPYSKRMLEPYTRFIASHTPHPTDPTKKVTSVKVYRVLHVIQMPSNYTVQADGTRLDPIDPDSYLPYYHGEYTPEGKLKDPNDPFLYWLIPIIRERHGDQVVFVDYRITHAELDDESVSESDQKK
jgi:hypothetical protein